MMRGALFPFACFCFTVASLRVEKHLEKRLEKRLCPSLDDAQIICQQGQVTVLAPGKVNERQLRFGNECATESVVSCAEDLSSVDQCDGKCGECSCTFDASKPLSAAYMQTMFDNMGDVCNAQSANASVLLIGLGGGELPQYLLRHCPHMRIHAVEISTTVIDMATRFFGLSQSQKSFPGRLSTQAVDSLTAVEKPAPSTYDVILVDCFQSGGQVPEACRSERFAKAAQRVLRPGGMLLQNIWHHAPNPSVAQQFTAAVATYKDVFGADRVADYLADYPKQIRWVDILKVTKSAAVM